MTSYERNTKEYLRDLDAMIGQCDSMARELADWGREYIARDLDVVLKDLYNERSVVEDLKPRD